MARWTPRYPIEALILAETLLADLTPRYPVALRALVDLQPGLSGRPVGTGDPGGGSGFTVTSVVERTALAPAPERAHLDRVLAAPALLTIRAGDVVEAMGARVERPPLFATAGQQLAWARWVIRLAIALHQHGWRIPHDHANPQHDRTNRLLADVSDLDAIVRAALDEPRPSGQRRVELATDLTESWCRSCLRIGQREPRSDRYAGDGLCRWCGDFHAAQGWLPTLDLLDARHAGRRITEAMIAAERPREKKRRRVKR